MTQQSESSGWTNYYKARSGRPPRPLLLAAMANFDGAGLQAIDLGCGEGTDTVALLQQGWQVLAIDQQPEAIARLHAQTPPELLGRLQTQVVAFEEVTLPPVDLIYAGFSLPFCQPTHFPAFWAKLVNAVRPGGCFAGQIFGDRDEWAATPDMTFLTLTETQTLLRSFTLEFFTEIDEDGQAVSGPKHWHYFEVIGRKR
ncbi:MAG: class I SAM-dependent methyltransferase [Caldilinea sp. CFX5]|nr:class I SAM-dependent methyltransferase [Caldilinea sp. CFX5]